jgi:CspA family cold shock protein
MSEGTIARLTDRGFGFIAQEGVEKDLFFHANEVVGTDFNSLREGDKVSFEVAEGQKGPNATNVQLASGDAASDAPTEDAAPADDQA